MPITVLAVFDKNSEEYFEGANAFKYWANENDIAIDLKTTVSNGKNLNELLMMFIKENPKGIFYAVLPEDSDISAVARAAESAGTYFATSSRYENSSLPLDYMYYVAHSTPDKYESGKLCAEYAIASKKDTVVVIYEDGASDTTGGILDTMSASDKEFFCVSADKKERLLKYDLTNSVFLCETTRAALTAASIGAKPENIVSADTVFQLPNYNLISCRTDTFPKEQTSFMLTQCLLAKLGQLSVSELSNGERYYNSKVAVKTSDESVISFKDGDWRSFISSPLPLP
ncbi:MAG: hypothetical protein IJO77_02770 [Oscillospiraceae bacterium]|nr:hypothetical protein [Oscillospiraceae bacterium]